MTDKSNERVKSQEQRQANLAPETHNDEQDDHLSQAQEVAEDARGKDAEESPLDSEKVHAPLGDSPAQDVIDEMRDMEQSGQIDMDAYRGEPNLDDNEGKYGDSNKVDPDLPSDGA
ncbi:hypothetical protein [Croceibacterium aestuarii]|uniref:hypothetical protein n=1 Tax=Croceibacterium aestuarii TaxID=3064139 RepID=UPI00272EA660|nr:hypothetical protein [Croceibacterium sp. D39]